MKKSIIKVFLLLIVTASCNSNPQSNPSSESTYDKEKSKVLAKKDIKENERAKKALFNDSYGNWRLIEIEKDGKVEKGKNATTRFLKNGRIESSLDASGSESEFGSTKKFGSSWILEKNKDLIITTDSKEKKYEIVEIDHHNLVILSLSDHSIRYYKK